MWFPDWSWVPFLWKVRHWVFEEDTDIQFYPRKEQLFFSRPTFTHIPEGIAICNFDVAAVSGRIRGSCLWNIKWPMWNRQWRNTDPPEKGAQHWHCENFGLYYSLFQGAILCIVGDRVPAWLLHSIPLTCLHWYQPKMPSDTATYLLRSGNLWLQSAAPENGRTVSWLDSQGIGVPYRFFVDMVFGPFV